MKRQLLVWDTPNMDMALSRIYGRKPLAVERPDMKVLLKWFIDRSADNNVDACVFVNYDNSRGDNPRFHGWLSLLSNIGYNVFVKPKTLKESDVDTDMLHFINSQRDEISEVVICSHDAACFTALSSELAQQGIRVILLGFTELVNGWDTHKVTFYDIETIKGLFKQPLPRHLNIWGLPETGTYFQPTDRPYVRDERTNRILETSEEVSSKTNETPSCPDKDESSLSKMDIVSVVPSA